MQWLNTRATSIALETRTTSFVLEHGSDSYLLGSPHFRKKMIKNLFEVVQGLFLPFVMLSFIAAFTSHFKSERLKSLFPKILAGIFVFVLFVSFLREKRLIKYNQINNIYLLVVSLISGAFYGFVCCLYSVRCSRKKTPESSRSFSMLEGFLTISGLLFVACLMLYKVPVVFSLPFHFLGMYDTYFSTMYLAKCTGYLLALFLCLLTAWAASKMLSRFSERTCALSFWLMYLVNGFISFVAVVGIINSYYRRRIKIPAGLRKSLPQLITAENLIFFGSILILIVLAVIFFIYHTKIHGEYTNPAEHRKLKACARNNRRWAGFLLFLCAFSWLDMTLFKKLANKIVELSPSEEFQIEGKEIFIPLEQVSDGHLHRFTWTNEAGKGIRFIIVQKKGTSFG
ncbi:MAG: hypothetical protein IJ727_05335, partial [Treponema sp.]|nr:hypothetical protein [Treponema sp.]